MEGGDLLRDASWLHAEDYDVFHRGRSPISRVQEAQGTTRECRQVKYLTLSVESSAVDMVRAWFTWASVVCTAGFCAVGTPRGKRFVACYRQQKSVLEFYRQKISQITNLKCDVSSCWKYGGVGWRWQLGRYGIIRSTKPPVFLLPAGANWDWRTTPASVRVHTSHRTIKRKHARAPDSHVRGSDWSNQEKQKKSVRVGFMTMLHPNYQDTVKWGEKRKEDPSQQ